MCISDKLATDGGKILPHIRAEIMLHMIAEGGRSGDDRKPANKRTRTCVALTNDAKWSGCKGVRGAAHPFASGRSGHGARILKQDKTIPQKVAGTQTSDGKEYINIFIITSSVSLCVLKNDKWSF